MRPDPGEAFLDGNGGHPYEQRIVAEAALALDDARAHAERRLFDPARQVLARGCQSRPREDQRGEEIETAQALRERPMPGIEQQRLVEDERAVDREAQPARVAPERPALATRHPTRAQRVKDNQRTGRGEIEEAPRAEPG